VSRHAVSLLIFLALAAPGADAAPETTDPARDILVTFDNAGARATTSGAPYRNRKRYAIAAAARQRAEAVADEYHLQAIDHWPIRSLSVYCFVYRIGDGDDRDQIIERLRADARVESVQPLNVFETGTSAAGDYDDTYADLQYGIEALHLSAAHRYTRGAGVRIVVIDSDVDADHEDLRGRIRRVEEFVARNSLADRQHGTAVTSVIAARANNARGIVGVAPEAQLDLYVACWSDAESGTAICDSFTLAKALDAVLEDPPDILNLSLTGPEDPLLHRLLAKAYEDDVVLIAARPADPESAQRFPASMPEVIAVGSSDSAAPPRFGPIYAPGQQILVAVPDNEYDFRSGSSLAAAHVSGVVALLLAISPRTRAPAVESILERSQLGAHTPYATVNACAALRLSNPALDCEG